MGQGTLFNLNDSQAPGEQEYTPALVEQFNMTQPDFVFDRIRPLVINPQLFFFPDFTVGDTVVLDLFHDRVFYGQVTRAQSYTDNTSTVLLRLIGFDHAHATFSITGGKVFLAVNVPEYSETYITRPSPHNHNRLICRVNTFGTHIPEGFGIPVPDPTDSRKETRKRFAPESGKSPSHGPASVPSGEPESYTTPEMLPQISGQPPGPSDTVDIDIMVVYTPAAAAWAASNEGGIHNTIGTTMATSQLVLDNSNTLINLNLVHTAELQYTESSSAVTDLYRLTFHEHFDPNNQENGPPWYMDTVHDLRDMYGADLVAFLIVTSEVGGLGWQLSNTQGSPAYGFSLTRVQQSSWTYTFVHEIGHNMGAHHHKDQNVQPGPGLFSYSAGWRWTGANNGKFCSVMTYTGGQYFADNTSHTRVPYFSDPLITHQGFPTGHANDGDNARTLRETKGVVSLYRTPPVPCVPLALPVAESFNTPAIPSCWSTQNMGVNIAERWSVSNSNHAGGSANEMMASWANVNPGTSRLITPALNTVGDSLLQLEFRHRFEDWGAGMTIRIQSSTDLTNWTDEAWFASSGNGNIGPAVVTTNIQHNLNSPNTYIAFVITGDLYQFDYWYIDDVEILRPCGHTVSGIVNYYNTLLTPMENVHIILTGNNLQYQATTDNNGGYEIENMCPGTYEVTFVSTMPVGGINATDAAQANSYGVAPYPLETVRFLAGDVGPGSRDGFIDGADASLILAHFITNGNQGIPFASDWVFWKAGETTTGQTFTPVFPGTLEVNVTGSQTENFYALVTGDFNRSFIPAGSKSGGYVVMQQDGSPIIAHPVAEILLPITAGFDMEVAALSLVLHYPAAKAEVTDVILGNNRGSIPFTVQNGIVRIGWYNQVPLQLTTGDTLLTLSVRTLSNPAPDESIAFTLAPDPLNELADGDNLVIPNALLHIETIETTTGVQSALINGDNITLKNSPNPFLQHTTFGFSIPVRGKVVLELFDLTGRKVAEPIHQPLDAGEHHHTVETSLLPPGIYMAKLSLNTGTTYLHRSLLIIRDSQK